MPQYRISRTDARAQGLSRYFTGKPCKRGHIAERILASGTCIECSKIIEAKYLAKPETIVKRKAHGVAYRANPGIKAQRKAYYTAWISRLGNHTRKMKQNATWSAKIETKTRQAIRRATEPQYRIPRMLRSRLNMAIRTGHGGGSAVRDLGCTIPEFKAYIEAQFQPDMTWENWTVDGWHLDHKVPLAVFDLTDRVQFLKASHYSNYQPLWAEHNLQKGNRLNWESRGEQENFLGSTR